MMRELVTPPIGSGNGHDRKSRPVALQETERSTQGYLVTYLEQVFFPGYDRYLQRKFTEATHLRRLGETIETALIPLFSVPGMERVDLSGSMARWIAHGMNPDYWNYMQFFQGEAQRCSSDRTPRARAFFGGPRAYAADPDGDISISGVSVSEISSYLIARYNVSDVTMVDGRNNYTLFQDQDYTVTISTGPIPTVQDIKNMIVSIHDTLTGKRVFHIDVSKLPESVGEAIREKRRGWSTDKQDNVWAALTIDSTGHIHYALSDDAMAIMSSPDQIQAQTPAAVAEVSIRGARIAFIHSNEERVNLDRFEPHILGDSLFRIRDTFRDLVDSGETIPPNAVELLQKELALCLTIDPYQTVQFLRDSNFAALIPRLRELHPTQWDAILRSNSFSLEMVNDRPIPMRERDLAYIHRQRLLYKTTVDSQGCRHFDGLKRFIDALQELNLITRENSNEWEEFFSLWEERRLAAIEESRETVPPLSLDARAVRRVVIDNKAVQIISEDGSDLSASQLQRLGEVIGRGEEFERALGTIHSHAIPGLTRRMGELDRGIPWRELEDSQQRESRRSTESSMALLYMLLQRYPSGLTPNELQRRYNNEVVHFFDKARFQVAFLGLKLLGLTCRYQRERETSVRRVIEDVELYFIYPPHFRQRTLNAVAEQSRFLGVNCYLRIVDAKEQFSNEEEYLNYIVNLEAAVLMQAGIQSVEVLESLTDIDFNLLNTSLPGRLSLQDLARKFRETMRWHYIREHRLGEDVPPVYREGFFHSPVGRKMLADKSEEWNP